MPIPFKCSCGQSYSVKDEQAGKRVRCPACNNILTVPVPAPPPVADEPLDVDLEEIPEVRPTVQVREGRRDRAPIPFQEPLEERPRRVRYDDDDDDRPIRKPRRRKRKSSGGSLVNGSAVAGGSIAIVIALVWFFGGLALGRIFFYPPILLIAGIIGVVKGLMGGE